MRPVISAEEIAYSYKEITAVDHISFGIGEGEVLGFLGPNGAGKTTTLNILTGLMKAQEGRVFIGGLDIAMQMKDVQAEIGVCFEEKNLYEEMSASENLRFYAALFGIRGFDPLPLLRRVGLPASRKDRVANFSKGMKQRLMVARALVNRPRALFLDEPTDGLDPVSAQAVRQVIIEEKERGAAVFLTTHDMFEADKLSDRVAFINDGRIVALDTPDELKHRHGKRRVRIRYRDNGSVLEEELELDAPDIGPKLNTIATERTIVDMHTEEATLEDIFIELTGRGLA